MPGKMFLSFVQDPLKSQSCRVKHLLPDQAVHVYIYKYMCVYIYMHRSRGDDRQLLLSKNTTGHQRI